MQRQAQPLPIHLDQPRILTNTHQKAEVAAQKTAAENAKKAAAEDTEWAKGAKSNAKK